MCIFVLKVYYCKLTQTHTHAQTQKHKHIHSHTYTHTYMHIYTYINVSFHSLKSDSIETLRTDMHRQRDHQVY